MKEFVRCQEFSYRAIDLAMEPVLMALVDGRIRHHWQVQLRW